MKTIKEVKNELKPIFDKHNVKKAIVFGSVAKNETKPNSDIDILVDSGLKGLKFFALLEDVASTVGRNVELIDTSQVVKNSRFEKEVYKNGVLIYG